MVFVDGSTLRHILHDHYEDTFGEALETRLHYEKLGHLVCGADREFLRLYYYVAEPAPYQRERTEKDERTGKQEHLPAQIGRLILR